MISPILEPDTAINTERIILSLSGLRTDGIFLSLWQNQMVQTVIWMGCLNRKKWKLFLYLVEKICKSRHSSYWGRQNNPIYGMTIYFNSTSLAKL